MTPVPLKKRPTYRQNIKREVCICESCCKARPERRALRTAAFGDVASAFRLITKATL